LQFLNLQRLQDKATISNPLMTFFFASTPICYTEQKARWRNDRNKVLSVSHHSVAQGSLQISLFLQGQKMKSSLQSKNNGKGSYKKKVLIKTER
jgi:hypothetical protein